ncbi:GNAT family N-acetyltransferase [Paramicrobacterium chengjingii]|uniref:GNAT family N-acetyltransferase n=1 Tax=Paramicrobacterium chengjingii TaxID=2769067 RepID=A0ABX6YNG4_9MICO|nr:GNAT family N-acetyltransferase [Microbacterium chengjingii]QPZ39916.1 GNAT family N-acetyltransferase [Microbacterium chengjingii]
MPDSTMIWTRVDDVDDRARRISAAVRHVVVQRSAAERRAIDAPKRTDGDIWLLSDAGRDIASLWMLRDGERIILADVDVRDASRITGSSLWSQFHGLAAQQAWEGAVHVSELGEDHLIAEFARAAQATRVATKMQVAVGAVPPARRISLEPMTEHAFFEYQSASIADYAQELLANGLANNMAVALERSTQQLQELLPDGLHSPGEHLWTVRDNTEKVGILWVHSDDARSFVYDIEMLATARGHGYGTETLRAAAAHTRDAGLPTLALNVFGSNESARRLYEREGYVVTEIMWSAALT